MEVSVTIFLNEITGKHDEKKITCGNGKHLSKGRFEEIVKEVRALRKMSESVPVNKKNYRATHLERFYDCTSKSWGSCFFNGSM